jgi:hypothetical protein
MSSTIDILLSMYNKGLKIWADNGRILYRAPKGAITPADIQCLRARKAEILETLVATHIVSTSEPHLVPRLPSDSVPLTYTQQARWNAFLVLGMCRNTRTLSLSLRLSGDLNIAALKMSFDEIVRRHTSLRTRIVDICGTPMQIIDPSNKSDLEIIDLTKIARSNVETEARKYVEDVVNEQVDMSVGPLFRARLLKLGDYDNVLVVALDHIMADGVSIELLMRDIEIMYMQAAHGLPPSLPQVVVQFADFAVWQQKNHQSFVKKHDAYWTNHLRGTSRIRLPAVERPIAVAGSKWEKFPVRFDKEISAGLKELSRRNGTTLPMSILSAYVASISRWCNQRDLVVGFLTTGRHCPEVENTIGFFASTIYLRIELCESDSFLDLLRRVTAEYYAVIEHQDFGLSAVPTLGPDVAQNPSFNWSSSARLTSDDTYISNDQLNDAGALVRTEPFPFVATAPEMEWDGDLPIYGGEPWLLLSEGTDGVEGVMRYRRTRFDSSSMKRLGGNFLSFARKILSDPTSRGG